MSAGNKFTLQLGAFVNAYRARAYDVVREVVIEVAKNLEKASPVGNRELWAANIKRKARGLPPLPEGYVGGTFRHNWQYGNDLSGVPTGVLVGTENDSVERISAQIPAVGAANMKHTLINNTAYALELERGHSGQAPQGMVGLAVVEFQDAVDKAAAKVRK